MSVHTNIMEVSTSKKEYKHLLIVSQLLLLNFISSNSPPEDFVVYI